MKTVVQRVCLVLSVVSICGVGQAAEAVPTTSMSPKPPVGTWYSLQRPTAPPLPFNPFPELQVLALEPGRFAFDDRSINYLEFKAEANAGVVTMSGPTPPPGPPGPPYPPPPPPPIELYGEGDLWLEIQRLGEDAVDLVLHNMKFNKWYQLLRKLDLNEVKWRWDAVYWNAAQYGLTDHDYGAVSTLDQPMKFFEVVEGDYKVSIQKVADAVEPGPGNNPPGQNGSFLVQRDHSGQALTVKFTIGGSAENGTDYATIQDSVSFAPSVTEVSITIQPIGNDGCVEFEESVILALELSSTDSYVVDPAAASATVTINDFFGTAPLQPVAVVPSPTGIDYSPTANGLLVSVNHQTGGNPQNFVRVYRNGSGAAVVEPWSAISGLSDEVKLTTVKSTANGFTAGEMYFGNGQLGGIGRLSPNGLIPTIGWSTLPGTSDHLRGSLYWDPTGLFGNRLVVVTGEEAAVEGERTVWTVEANETPHLIAAIRARHLEGVVTLPNDVSRWGPWAGKIITGDESSSRIYAIAPDGTSEPFELEIDAEDFDLIPANQDLYCCNYQYEHSTILKLPRSLLTCFVGDLLITQAGEPTPHENAKLVIVRWNGSQSSFEKRTLTVSTGWFEHVTFAPIDLNPLP